MSLLGTVRTTITATAGGIASALQIGRGQVFTQVSTVNVANDGVKLPVDAVGTLYIIRNDGGNALSVFPPNAASNINALGAGTALTLANGAQARFIITPNSALGAGSVQYFTF